MTSTPPPPARQEAAPAVAATRPRWSLGGAFEFASVLQPRQLALLFVAFNFAFLAFDVYLAHGYTGRYFVVSYEWIPVVFSPLAAVTALLMAAMPNRSGRLALAHLSMMATLLAVGLVGFVMHLLSAMGATGHLSWSGIVWAAPLLAPLSFSGVALVGIVAAAREQSDQPGRLELLGGVVWAPFSQQQHLHLLNGLGLLAATLLAIIDHSRTAWDNPLLWLPVVGGFFATGLVLHHAVLLAPSRREKIVYFWTMLATMVVGLTGLSAHIWVDLAGTGQFSWERLLRGAPPFAPMLFANMALLGLIALIEPIGRSGELIRDNPPQFA